MTKFRRTPAPTPLSIVLLKLPFFQLAAWVAIMDSNRFIIHSFQPSAIRKDKVKCTKMKEDILKGIMRAREMFNTTNLEVIKKVNQEAPKEQRIKRSKDDFYEIDLEKDEIGLEDFAR